MKKLLLLSASLVILVASYAQTESKTKNSEKSTSEKQPVKKDVKKVETKPSSTASGKAKTSGKSADKKSEKTTGNTTQVAAPAESAVPVKTEPVAETKLEQPAAPPAPLADPNKDFEFTNDAYDFGKIPAGKAAKYTLTIKNISTTEQELTLVQPGCGCTTPEYTQNQKFKPGESVKVTLGYNGGAPGSGSPFSKSVTVTLKGHSPKVVTFKGETYAVPAESAPSNEAAEKLKPAGK